MILGPREVVHDPLSAPDGHTLFRLDLGVKVVTTVGQLSHNLTCSFSLPQLKAKETLLCAIVVDIELLGFPLKTYVGIYR